MWLKLRLSLFGFRLLTRRVGLMRLPGLLWAVWRQQRKGAPWNDLGPPASKRERECRDQMGQVILLHDAIAAKLDPQRAREIVGELVSEAAVVQLRSFIPKNTLLGYRDMAPETRERILTRTLDKFPNSTVGKKVIEDEVFEFHVTRCEFVELARSIGQPEMAQLFCVGDALYFERDVPQARFDRPSMLSEGGERCLFRIRWAADE